MAQLKFKKIKKISWPLYETEDKNYRCQKEENGKWSAYRWGQGRLGEFRTLKLAKLACESDQLRRDGRGTEALLLDLHLVASR